MEKVKSVFSLKRPHQSTKISVKIAVIFLLLICMFWGILFVKFYYSSYKESLEYAQIISTQTLNTIKRNITTLVENAAYDSRLILSSSDITDALESGDMKRQKESLYQFISLIDFETHINGIYIADMNNNVCSIDRSCVRTFRTEHLDKIGWYDEVIALQGSYCLKVNADKVLTQSTMTPTVSLIRAVISPDDFLPVGILMINMDSSAFEDCYSSITGEDVPTIFVLDETGKIVTSRPGVKLPEVQEILSSTGNGSAISRKNDQRIFYEETIIESNDWQILTGVKVGSAFSVSDAAEHFLFFGFEALTIFGILSYFVMHQYVTVPLRKVVGFMNRMRGKKFQKMELTNSGTYYELEILKETYNHMVDEIDLLVERVYEEERIKRKTELNILQEQMKPHFLYNTIDAMSYLALAEHNDRLYDALEAFGGYYRTLLSKGKEWITVEAEMEMVKDYLELQKLRYGTMLEYELEMDENLRGKQVLKMILQPFVENSVNHGIRAKGTGGTVRVSGKLIGSHMLFQIEDDGIGISDEIIEKLQCENLERNEKSFGMRGTIERMKIFYDSDIQYEIRSRIGVGTTIVLMVPVNGTAFQ